MWLVVSLRLVLSFLVFLLLRDVSLDAAAGLAKMSLLVVDLEVAAPLEPVGEGGLLRAGEREAASFRMAGHKTWGPHPLCLLCVLSENSPLERPQHHHHLVPRPCSPGPGEEAACSSLVWL